MLRLTLIWVPENSLPARGIDVSVRGQHQRAAVLRRAVLAFLVFEVSGRGFGTALRLVRLAISLGLEKLVSWRFSPR